MPSLRPQFASLSSQPAPVGQDPVVRCQNPVVWCQDPVVWCQDPVDPVGQDPVVWCQDPVSHNPVVRYQDPVEKDTHRRTLTQEDAEKEARKQLQDLRLQGKPVTFLRPTAPFTYLGVMLTMTLNWKPQHTAMITQLRQKLDRLRRSFASARQAIHIIKTAIIPSLAYSFCVVPCTPGDLDLFDRAVNQCVKHKLNLPLGTPNAVIRDDIDKLGLGISSAAQEYHARNTTALVSSLQSADNTYAHISRCMLHKQITWLYAQAAKHGHRTPNLLQHTLRARQLLHTTTTNLFAPHEGAPLYPKETKALGQVITQSASPLPRDIVSACITCLKSLGLTHPSELICQDNIHIMSGDSLRKRSGTKLTPHITAHTGPRYTDIRAYMTAKTLAKDTQPPTPNPITATARSKLTNNVPKPPTAKQPTPQPRIGSKRPAEDRHTEADDRHTQTIPDVVTHIPIMTLANLNTWKADTARQHKDEKLGIMLGAMYDHQESITAIDGWHWNGNNQESYYNVHWRPTIIEKWALQMYKKEGYTPAHTEDICRADAEHVCTCELCWEPKEDSPMCNNCMRAYHPACLAKTGLAGQARDDHWLCPVCAHGEDDLKTAMRNSVETDLIKAHWHPTTETKPLILAYIDYTDKKNEYDADNSKRQEARRRPLDAALPEHTRQGLPDPHTWIPRCTDLHSRATFNTSPVNPQTDIVGTGSGHYKHMHLPADRELPATGHMRQPNQIAPPFRTTSSMVIPNWRTVTYTDGSCMQGTDRAPSRKVGAGVYTPENDERLTIALPDHNTINRAELAAIHAAIKSGATHIATDSLCSIYQIRRALANPMSIRTHHHRDILADIATLIMNSRDTIHLRKVRAHSGIIGNEAADTLAKHAAMYSGAVFSTSGNVKQARHFMELAQRRQAYLANKGRKEVEYHTGQLVLLNTKNLRMKPDLPQAMARMHAVFHVSLLRPYTSEHPHLPPPVEWLDEAPLYEVEKLLAHRGVRAATVTSSTLGLTSELQKADYARRKATIDSGNLEVVLNALNEFDLAINTNIIDFTVGTRAAKVALAKCLVPSHRGT
ncbi:hypothetical protein QJQ45_006180 [Haematococcus lacustris]|nr:hypothetical protein QJQ45_006180 [Haematococcus lacustris]